jgi:hypothetical protein
MQDEGRFFVCSAESCGKRIPKFAFAPAGGFGGIVVSDSFNLREWLRMRARTTGIKDVRRREMKL